MNHVQTWSLHFKVSPEKLEQIQKSLKAGQSPIYKCIESGLLVEADYILWAKNYFRLPTLKTSFFDQPVPVELIAKFANKFPEYTLPVVEQDNTIFVACLEPIENFQFTQPVQWIIAPYSKYKTWMPSQPHEKPIEKVSTKIPETIPEIKADVLSDVDSEIPVAIFDPVILNPPPAQPPTAIQMQTEAPAKLDPTKAVEIDFTNMDLGEDPVEPTAIGIIPGVDQSFRVKIDDNTLDEFSKIAPLDLAPVLENTDAPPGVVPYAAVTPPEEAPNSNHNGNSRKFDKPAPVLSQAQEAVSILTAEAPKPEIKFTPKVDVPGLDLPSIAAHAPEEQNEEVTGISDIRKMKVDLTVVGTPAFVSDGQTATNVEISFSGISPTKPSIPNSPPVIKKSEPTTNVVPLTAKLLNDELAPVVGKPLPPPPPVETHPEIEIDHGEVALQTLNKEAPEVAFAQMKTFFNQCMILLFETQKLKPWKFDNTWLKATGLPDALDLSTPSIFRIVAETRKSYHGHVIPNQINDAFFTSWNQGRYPEHITICPLLVKGTLVGMLLGGTSKDKSRAVKLDTIERIASQLAQELQVPKAA